MTAGTGIDGSLDHPKDVDAIVSSFLEELETITHELRPAGETPAREKPLAAVLKAAESTPKKSSRQHLIGLIAALAFIAVLVVPATRLLLKPAAVNIPRSRDVPAQPVKIEHPVSNRFNETAQLLAGMPVDRASSLYRISLSLPFQRHRKEMQTFWRRIQTGSLNAIRPWSAENVPAGLEKNPVLYPLSGADYLNAYSFFPHSTDYLLIALESPGTIPDLNLLTEEEMDNSLSAIRQSVRSMASVNYLQSRSMREGLTTSSFRGVVPLLLLFAAGLGHEIRDVHAVMIGPEGRLVPDAGENEPRQFRRVAGINVPSDYARGVQIQFADAAGRESRSLTYLQLELRSEIFVNGRPEGKFLSGLKHRNTILKSAVYLLHGGAYSKVRQFILGSSDLVIQDDSGIPYQDFVTSTWEEHLFGKYIRALPLGTLHNPPQQPLLARQYGLGSRRLDFPYGYGVLRGPDESNLMLFVKKR